MEDKLKKLSISMDQEISKSIVFTKEDEQQILSKISQTPEPRAHVRRPSFFVPKFLTAALFSGILFSSYVYFDKELSSKPNLQKEEAHIFYQSVSGEGSVEYSPYLDKKQLNIKFLITNQSNKTIKRPVEYRITFLNSELVKAVGSESVTVEPSKSSSLAPGKSDSITKQFILNDVIAKEDLVDAIQIETISGTKIMDSFVIKTIDYQINENTEDDDNYPFIKKINIDKADGKFFVNGVTLGMSIKDAYRILNRPRDGSLEHLTTSIAIGEDYNDPNLYEDSLGFNFSEDNKTTFISVSVSESDDLEKDINELGNPYYTSETGNEYYYDENTNQILSVAIIEKDKFFIHVYYKNEGDPF
jgi:hypothetical protein